jgi:signal transduction histidine kinase
LQQVIANLVHNSLIHTDHGPILLCVDFDKENNRLDVEVGDEGDGIEE